MDEIDNMEAQILESQSKSQTKTTKTPASPAKKNAKSAAKPVSKLTHAGKEKRRVKFVQADETVPSVIDSQIKKETIIMKTYRDVVANQMLKGDLDFATYDEFLTFVESLNNASRTEYIEKQAQKVKGSKGSGKTVKTETKMGAKRTDKIFVGRYSQGWKKVTIKCSQEACKFEIGFDCDLNDESEPTNIKKRHIDFTSH